MEAFLTGIGWVTGAGFGTGRQGGDCSFPALPLPVLTRKDVFPEPNQRFGRMSDYAKLGLAAIAFALRDAGLEAWSEKRQIGVVASTRFGCLATDLDYHSTVQLQGGGLASPNLFAYTLANCFLGDAAIQFGLTGSSVAVNESGCNRLGALRMALEALQLGEADAMLAGICDLAPPQRYAGETGPAGAAFLVLAPAPPAAPAHYGSVTLADDGSILFNGSPAGGMPQLIACALAGRTDR